MGASVEETGWGPCPVVKQKAVSGEVGSWTVIKKVHCDSGAEESRMDRVSGRPGHHGSRIGWRRVRLWHRDPRQVRKTMPQWKLVHEGQKSYHLLACSSVYLCVNWVQGHEMFWL